MEAIYNTLGLAAIILIAALVVAVIRPIKYSKLLGKHATRPRLILLFFVLIMLTGLLLNATEPESVKKERLAKEQQRLEQLQKDQKEKEQAELRKREENKRKSDEEIAKVKAAQSLLDDQQAAEDTARNVEEAQIRERNYWHKVVRVVDGDTVRALVDGKEEAIRIIGINAPESTTSNECFGVNASNKAKEFLEGKWIQLERDETQDTRDKYGRLLAYVWFDSGTDFGRRMIEEGYAYEYTYSVPYNKQAQYKETQAYAESKDHGLWASSTCNGSTSMPYQTPVITPAPTPQPAPAPSSNCDPNYSPCIRYVAGNSLNCPDIGIMVKVIGTDHHKFDANGDGYGCESYQ